MGIFSKIMDQGRNGEFQNITCKECGDTYHSNISRDFPYAICGRCLENARYYAEQRGDRDLVAQINNEFSRRRRQF